MATYIAASRRTEGVYAEQLVGYGMSLPGLPAVHHPASTPTGSSTSRPGAGRRRGARALEALRAASLTRSSTLLVGAGSLIGVALLVAARLRGVTSGGWALEPPGLVARMAFAVLSSPGHRRIRLLRGAEAPRTPSEARRNVVLAPMEIRPTAAGAERCDFGVLLLVPFDSPEAVERLGRELQRRVKAGPARPRNARVGVCGTATPPYPWQEDVFLLLSDLRIEEAVSVYYGLEELPRGPVYCDELLVLADLPRHPVLDAVVVRGQS